MPFLSAFFSGNLDGLLAGISNRPQHGIKILIHFIIGETNHAIALCFEPGRARGVIVCSFWIIVAVAINLDDNLELSDYESFVIRFP